jgi:hypothetical protein
MAAIFCLYTLSILILLHKDFNYHEEDLVRNKCDYYNGIYIDNKTKIKLIIVVIDNNIIRV